jgi:DNA polymerase alpha subunit B
MADSDVEELNTLFATPGTELEADVLAELQSIMRLHSIPPQELFYKWESYSIKMGSDDMKLNVDTARALKKDVQEGLEREVRSKAHIRSAEKRGGTPRNVSNATGVFDMYVRINSRRTCS